MKHKWQALLRQHAQQLPDLHMLEEHHHQTLLELVESTIQRETQALESALEQALSFVPRLLRGTVKKLVLR